MGQKVESRIIDRNGEKGLDTIAAVREGGLGIWVAHHVKEMDGDFYLTSWFNNNVAVGGVLDIRLVTAAARKLIFLIEGQSGRVRFQFYENPNATLGTLLAAVPPDFGANLANNFAWHTPVVTGVGTLHFDMYIRQASDHIFTIQPSSDRFSYLVRLTNISGAINDISVNIGTFV